GWVITADVQFTFWIDQIAVHRRAAFLTATFGAQGVGFRVVTFQYVENFVLRHQMDGGFAAFFRRQCIARAAQEYARCSGTNDHLTAAGGAVDAGQYHLVRQHTALFRIFLGFIQLIGKVAKEAVEYLFPFRLVAGNLVKTVFHLRGEIIVHQLAEVGFQTVGNNFTHFFSVEATVFDTHVATVLDGRDDRRIGRRTTDTAFFQLFHQRGFAETGWRLGEVLSRDQFNQRQFVPFVDSRQRSVFIAFTQGRHYLCPAVEAQNASTRLQTEIPRANGQRSGIIFRGRHLTCYKLTPDQLIQLLCIRFHIFQRFR